MDSKELVIKSFTWNDVKVFLSVWEYQLGWLYILLVEEETGEDYCDLSVFVKPLEKRNQMCVDVNNCPNAEEFIRKYNLWVKIWEIDSWFVTYPIYEMDLDELREYDNLWVRDFEKDTLNNEEIWDQRSVWDALKSS